MDRVAQLHIVKTALDAEDPEGLLALDCPADEYNQEASIIAGRIETLRTKQAAPLSVEQIASAVAEVWNKQFGPLTSEDLERRRPSFLAVANRISAQT
jgi:hypothetical protein